MEDLLSTGPTPSSFLLNTKLCYSSYGLGVKVSLEYFTKDESVSESINYEGVGRTAPATPGRLIMVDGPC